MLTQNSYNKQNINNSNQLFHDKTNTFLTKSFDDLNIESLKIKINNITQYQKPYISKLFNELLVKNPENGILCIYLSIL